MNTNHLCNSVLTAVALFLLRTIVVIFLVHCFICTLLYFFKFYSAIQLFGYPAARVFNKLRLLPFNIAQ